MFKPELWQGHDEYRTIVNTYGRRLSRNNTKYSFDLYDKQRKTSLTLWVTENLPNSIFLTILVGCTCTEELPPLGSYYDFMDRFWMASRSIYSRHSLLPAGRYSKKPGKYWATVS